MNELAQPVSLAKAARELQLHAATLRRWVREGAPVWQEGAAGRGKGALVVVTEIAAWRVQMAARRAVGTEVEFVAPPDGAEALQRKIAQALWRALTRGRHDESEPLHALLGVSSPKAFALCLRSYKEIHQELWGEWPTPNQLPPEMETARACAVLPPSIRQRFTE
ncbi:MAG TPA: hypothetical protein VFB37_07195 [Steroidobacteraceae bacterium]|nr:hypothetical protein [Steroidobacteraceae bacterium]